MKFLKYVTILILLCGVTVANAQKFGHINSADLLQLMPEIKKADSTLQAYQKQLEDQNQTMITEFQTKAASFQKDEATMPDAVKEVKQQELQDLQTRIQQFQQGAQDKFSTKKEELYSPILKRAEDGIKAVAKESSYAYVFDTSAGAVVYAQESDDIMPLVKKKLGLK
ncbi:MAG: OmpH family outer membrane protein [Chitinophagales bacterium]|nr:OmpH family outer membrane protein [Chitinophagales bacterium]